jgi:hypothetical protein
MRRTDHSSRGVLPAVARRVRDLENLVNEEAVARVGLQHHVKNAFVITYTTFYSRPFPAAYLVVRNLVSRGYIAVIVCCR